LENLRDILITEISKEISKEYKDTALLDTLNRILVTVLQYYLTK
jgi:hypothetical protein